MKCDLSGHKSPLEYQEARISFEKVLRTSPMMKISSSAHVSTLSDWQLAHWKAHCWWRPAGSRDGGCVAITGRKFRLNLFVNAPLGLIRIIYSSSQIWIIRTCPSTPINHKRASVGILWVQPDMINWPHPPDSSYELVFLLSLGNSITNWLAFMAKLKGILGWSHNYCSFWPPKCYCFSEIFRPLNRDFRDYLVVARTGGTQNAYFILVIFLFGRLSFEKQLMVFHSTFKLVGPSLTSLHQVRLSAGFVKFKRNDRIMESSLTETVVVVFRCRRIVAKLETRFRAQFVNAIRTNRFAVLLLIEFTEPDEVFYNAQTALWVLFDNIPPRDNT